MNEKSTVGDPAKKLFVCICVLFALLQAAVYASTDSLAGGTWKQTTHGSLLYPQAQSDKPTTINWPDLVAAQSVLCAE